MSNIIFISKFDPSLNVLKERGIVSDIKNLSVPVLTEEIILYYIKELSFNDLIFIHSAKEFNIKGYNIVYFSFGCLHCGQKKEFGLEIKDIIQILNSKKEINEIEKRGFQKRLYNLKSKTIKTQQIEKEILSFKEKKTPTCKENHCYLYISDILQMNQDVKSILKKIKPIISKEELKELILQNSKNEFIYLIVPFGGFGYPSINIETLDIVGVNEIYNRYFLELKKIQEESSFNIIFLFLSLNNDYIPNFFKELKYKDFNTTKRNIDKIFLSPLKDFNKDNHIKFLFAETIYDRNRNLLNFFTFLDKKIDVTKINEYFIDNLLEKVTYSKLKEIYYDCLFFDEKKVTEEKVQEYSKYWEINKSLKYDLNRYSENKNIFHNFDLADVRTNMPFYISSMFNKLGIIKTTFQNQQLDFLLIDDKETIDSKKESIENILETIFYDKSRYMLSKDEFNKMKFDEDEIIKLVNKKRVNIRNSNFILIDFLLDPEDGVFFGSDFIEKIEKIKKKRDEQFKSWYFITSYLSNYVNKFEIDKIMYEYHDTSIVQIGDSTHRKFKIFFIKKLIHFIYSKVNIYIRLIAITGDKNLIKNFNLLKKLIIIIQTLLQQIDLLELRYIEQVNIAQKFYTLSSYIIQDYVNNIEEKTDTKEIKFQEIKILYKKLSNGKNNNEEIKNIYNLIKRMLFQTKG